jgi:hypothetical protein
VSILVEGTGSSARGGRTGSPRARRRRSAALHWVAIVLLLAAAARADTSCTGDCNGDRMVTVDELLLGVNISLGLASPSACPALDRNGDGTVSIDEIVSAVSNALQGCGGGQTHAFVVTSDLSAVGSFGTIALDPPRTVMPSSPQRLIYRDAVARIHEGLIYVINRLFADNIQVLDPASNFATRLECSTVNGTNPHDIAFVDDTKAYITRFETSKLLIVNPSAQPSCKDFIQGTIDLSSLADADGNPDMDQMAIVDGRLYVSLERLNVNSVLRTPAENGAIAVIDTATDELIGGIPLRGENPFSPSAGLTVRDGGIYVTEVGLFGVLDGGIERVDLQTQRAEGFLVTEQALGGDITDFAIVSDHLIYAVVNYPNFTNALVAVDPTTCTDTMCETINTLRQSAGFTFVDVELDDRGELYVADRSLHTPGVRIFRAADGVELTSSPIDLVLPPVEIVFYP